jgi:hypothetical protein
LQRSLGKTVVLGDADGSFRVIQDGHAVRASAPSRPAVPNYIRRLREFVLGE